MRSEKVTKGAERAPNRSLFYALGYTPEDLEKPLIAVVSAHSDIVPGHMNLDKLTDAAGRHIPMGKPYAVAVKSSVPVLCQYSRLDTTQVNMSLMTTIAAR